MDETTLRAWFDAIMLFAKNNYGTCGWDNFVECVGFSDFKSDAKRHGWLDKRSAFEHYENWCELKAERQEEHDAEARSSW